MIIDVSISGSQNSQPEKEKVKLGKGSWRKEIPNERVIYRKRLNRSEQDRQNLSLLTVRVCEREA